jgi:U3 small nucleolar ribonucleoprotein component
LIFLIFPFAGLVVFSYGDFFGAKKKKVAKQKSKLKDGSEESDMDDEQEDDEAFENKVLFISICSLQFNKVYACLAY